MLNQQRLRPCPEMHFHEYPKHKGWKSQPFQGLAPPHQYQMCRSLLTAPAQSCLHISPRFRVSSLSRASLLPSPPNYLIQLYLFRINVQVWSATQEKMSWRLWMCSLGQHHPAGFVWSFLLSPSSEGPAPRPPSLYCPGFPCRDSYCTKWGENKAPALGVVVYLAHCDFQKNLDEGWGKATSMRSWEQSSGSPRTPAKPGAHPVPLSARKHSSARAVGPTKPGGSPPTQTALTPFRSKTQGKRLLSERDFFLRNVVTPQKAIFEGNVADRKSQDKSRVSKAGLWLMSKMRYWEFETRLRIRTPNEKPTRSNSSLPCWRHCESSYCDSFQNILEFCLPAEKAKRIIFYPPYFPKLSVLIPFFSSFSRQKWTPLSISYIFLAFIFEC